MPKEYLPSQTILGTVPLAESIIYFDDFESSIQWNLSGTGADYRVDVVSDRSFTGAYCMDLISRSAYAAADEVHAYRDLYLPVSQRVRLVCHFMVIDLDNTSDLQFRIQHTDGATDVYSLFLVQYDTANFRWEYYNGTTWVTITGMTQYMYSTGWNRLTLDVDVGNSLYTTIECNDVSASIATLVPSTGADTSGEHLRIQVGHLCTGVARSEVLYDDILLQAI